MRRVIVLITALAVMLSMMAGPVLAAPHKKPEPPKKNPKVCLQWTKIVKWSDKKFQKENKYYKVKAKKAYAYQAVKDWTPVIGDELGLDTEKFFWKFKVVKKPLAKCVSKKKKPLPKLPEKIVIPLPPKDERKPVCHERGAAGYLLIMPDEPQWAAHYRHGDIAATLEGETWVCPLVTPPGPPV